MEIANLLPETDEEKVAVREAYALAVAMCGNELHVTLEGTPDHSFVRVRCTSISEKTLKALIQIADDAGLRTAVQAENIVVHMITGPQLGAGIVITISGEPRYMLPGINGGTHEPETM